MNTSRRHFVQGVAASAGVSLLADSASAADGLQTLTGKVVRLADVIAKAGGKLDTDAAPFWLSLQTDDGKLYPLVKDGGSRLFFKDPALLNRPMRLQGRLVPGSTLLRTTFVNSVKNGQLFDIYYWCDICSIKRPEKMVCECCGGPMTLQEEAVKK